MTKAELLRAIEPASDDAEIVVQTKALFSRSEVAWALGAIISSDNIELRTPDERLLQFEEPVGYNLESANTCGGHDESKKDCHVELWVGQTVLMS
jgi:hypothetical protein